MSKIGDCVLVGGECWFVVLGWAWLDSSFCGVVILLLGDWVCIVGESVVGGLDRVGVVGAGMLVCVTAEEVIGLVNVVVLTVAAG